MSVSRVATALGISWHTANSAVLTHAQSALLGDSHRFDGVEVLGVDDAPARFAPVREVPPLSGATPGGATSTPAVIIDLTPVRHEAGPARLLDVIEDRSKKTLKTWLAQRDQAWRERVEVVAMDGFTGFKNAAGEEVPKAQAVMDPYTRRVPGRRQAR